MRCGRRRMDAIEQWEIPTNWKWVQISELGKIVAGGTPSTKESSYWGDEINWITPADLSGYNDKFILKGAKSLSKKGLEKSSAQLMPSGSIHFSSRAPIGYVVISKEEISTNQGFKSLVPANEIFNEYVYYYFKSAKQLAEKRASGTTFKEISKKSFSLLPIPIAPYNEQRAIVYKIEQLFSDLDNGIENFKKAQEQLKIYRQAVLKKAFEGDLTKKWREEQTDLPSAKELLQQVKEEREKQYQKQLDEWEQAVKDWEDEGEEGKKPTKPKKPNELPPLIKENLEELPELPEGWEWDFLRNVTINITDGDHQPPPKSKLGIPFITISNIKSNKIGFSNTFFVNQEYYDSLIDYRKPKQGDILYTVTGSFGIPVLIDFNKPFCFQRHIGLVRPHSQINNKWLFWLLQTNFIYNQAQKSATGTAQKTVALSSLRKFMIPLCSTQEQNQIFSEIETRLSICDKMEATIAESLEKAESLRQSILKKAFEGKLVNEKELEEARNAPDWEPAEKLLERIHQEKQINENNNKPTRRKTHG